MTETTVASSYIRYNDNHELVAYRGQPFVLSAYSRMKYGSQVHARMLGLQLAEDLIAEAPLVVFDPTPMVALITYKFVPSAAATITRATASRLSEARYQAGLGEVNLVHVKTGKVLGRDYSSLSEEGRAAYITETGYKLHAEDVAGTNVLVIDDIRNTGAAENLIRDLLEGKNHRSTLLAYLAIMDTESARRDPSVENRINTATVQSLEHLNDIIEKDGMTLTVRTMKMVLGEKNHARLIEFLNVIPEQLLYELYAGTIGSGQEFLNHYRDGFTVLRRVAIARGIL